jgi:V-type H+-transporting ATPase subunit e
VLSITAVTCMWMMWAIIYMAQMHPLVQPVMNKSEE